MSSDSGEKDPLVGKDTGDSTNSSTGGGGTGLIRQDSKSYYFAPLKSRQNTMDPQLSMEESGTTQYRSIGNDEDDDEDVEPKKVSSSFEIQRETEQYTTTTPTTSMGGGGPGAAVVSAEEAAADSERGTASEQSKHAFSGFMSVVNGIANMLGMKGALPVGGVGSRVNKLRVVPVKIEPKVYFANERTFLDWMHMSVLLATISTAIIAFAEANEYSQIYGLVLLPTSIGFAMYALYVYMKRANMIRNKDPGPYEEKVGPILLATLLAITIVANFAIRLYDIIYL